MAAKKKASRKKAAKKEAPAEKAEPPVLLPLGKKEARRLARGDKQLAKRLMAESRGEVA